MNVAQEGEYSVDYMETGEGTATLRGYFRNPCRLDEGMARVTLGMKGRAHSDRYCRTT